MALKQDAVHFYLGPSQGNKIVGVLLNHTMFVLTRVRVLIHQPLTYKQILVEYPLPTPQDVIPLA